MLPLLLLLLLLILGACSESSDDLPPHAKIEPFSFEDVEADTSTSTQTSVIDANQYPNESPGDPEADDLTVPGEASQYLIEQREPVTIPSVAVPLTDPIQPTAEDKPPQNVSPRSMRLYQIGPSQLQELVKRSDVVILDIRTPAEYARRRLTGAINLDYYHPDFGAHLARLDRHRPYLIYCRSGRRSSAVLASLQTLGFQEIYHLQHGIISLGAKP
jgi:rhodanese-related sulfurtransferase